MSQGEGGFEAGGFLPDRADFHRKTEKQALVLKGHEEFKPTEVESVLEHLRIRDRATPVIIRDGIDLLKADRRDVKALGNSAVVNLEKYEKLMDAFDRIEDTLDKVNRKQRGEDMPALSYDELFFTLSYFRVQKEAMDEAFYRSAGSEQGKDYAGVYSKVLRSIYKELPFVAEAYLPDIPRHLPAPLERYLDTVTTAQGDKQMPTHTDTQAFYTGLAHDVTHARDETESEEKKWKEQKKVMLRIHRYREEHKPTTPLLVTVTGDDVDIVAYNPEEGSLQEQMKASEGTRKFIFDPASNDDMKYMSDLFDFDRYVFYPPFVMEGLENLTAWENAQHLREETEPQIGGEQTEGMGGKRKKNKEKRPKVKLTSAQVDGMRFYRGLFLHAIKDGRLDRDKYKNTLEAMGEIQIAALRDADYELVPDPALPA